MIPTDWKHWIPSDEAVLCFVIDAGRVLLIHKKRGLGSGKINGPGGRIEGGETAYEAAVRETQEEVGVTPIDLQSVATLSFAFADGYGLRCEVFLASRWTGTLTETDEAVPFWSPLEAIPYDAMWQDDRYWLPEVLAGREVAGYFTFESDTMTSCALYERKTGTPFPGI
ncbi:MAG: 8-oxo-dGTP diphosphatase [Spirochaetaceae bacterium]|nr:MAG: 8-oxo-dGTP diphosphatase [Spirochaetaceae bacterium]